MTYSVITAILSGSSDTIMNTNAYAINTKSRFATSSTIGLELIYHLINDAGRLNKLTNRTGIIGRNIITIGTNKK